MHGTLSPPIRPTAACPLPAGTSLALRWLVRVALAAIGLGLIGGLALALATGLMEFC
jgi:hypothetical protein